MSDALRYEWVRLRTVRSTWSLTALTVLLTGAVALLIALGVRSSRDFDPETGAEIAHRISADEMVAVLTAGVGLPFAPIAFAPLFMGMIGVFAFGHEYRHGTIRATLTALPRRDVVALAKVVTVVLFSGVVAAVCLAVDTVIAQVVLGGRLGEAEVSAGTLVRVCVGFALLTVLWGVVGLALAGLFRNVPAAIVTILVVPLVVEPILFGLFQAVPALDAVEDWVRFLPFNAGKGMLWVAGGGPEGGEGVATLSPLAGGLTFAAAVAAVLAVTWWLFRKRDA